MVGITQENHGTGGAADLPALPSSVDRRILVIDSNLFIAEAIVLALTQLQFAARFVVPLTTSHVRDLVSWKPGLALLDIDSIDSETCLSCVSIFNEARIPVAIMGSRLDVPLLGECLNAGASSVVDKGFQLADLVAVIIRLLAGEAVMGDDEKRQLLAPIQREVRARRAQLAPFDVLTHREKCVLAEIMDGHSAEAIARRRAVSISTVRSQIKAILQKLGVNSQLAAASMARQAGWSLDVAPGGIPPGASPTRHLEASA